MKSWVRTPGPHVHRARWGKHERSQLLGARSSSTTQSVAGWSGLQESLFVNKPNQTSQDNAAALRRVLQKAARVLLKKGATTLAKGAPSLESGVPSLRQSGTSMSDWVDWVSGRQQEDCVALEIASPPRPPEEALAIRAASAGPHRPPLPQPRLPDRRSPPPLTGCYYSWSAASC